MNQYRKSQAPAWYHYLAAILVGVTVTMLGLYLVITLQPQ